MRVFWIATRLHIPLLAFISTTTPCIPLLHVCTHSPTLLDACKTVFVLLHANTYLYESVSTNLPTLHCCMFPPVHTCTSTLLHSHAHTHPYMFTSHPMSVACLAFYIAPRSYLCSHMLHVCLSIHVHVRIICSTKLLSLCLRLILFCLSSPDTKLPPPSVLLLSKDPCLACYPHGPTMRKASSTYCKMVGIKKAKNCAEADVGAWDDLLALPIPVKLSKSFQYLKGTLNDDDEDVCSFIPLHCDMPAYLVTFTCFRVNYTPHIIVKGIAV